MNQIGALLPQLDKVNTSKIKSERAYIISQFVEEINKERPSQYKDKNGKIKKLGLVSGREIAIKLSHLKDNGTLYYLLSICRDYQKTKGSFSFKFNCELKVR